MYKALKIIFPTKKSENKINVNYFGYDEQRNYPSHLTPLFSHIFKYKCTCMFKHSLYVCQFAYQQKTI